MPSLTVDGEAIDGLYALIRTSDGRELAAAEGRELRTAKILEFLASSDKPLYHCFGTNYDVNMWIRDLSVAHLRKLWEFGSVWWKGWLLQWIPTKQFSARTVDGDSFRVEECWGYFQTSFINALERWNIDCPAVIEWGKRERVDFHYDQLEHASAYCLSECEALSDLMDRVKACTASIGLKPKTWIGPGVLASGLMRKNGMREHHVTDTKIPGWAQASEAVMSAYFGGRVETYAQGRYDKAYAYDISSAYPAAMLELPSMAGAEIVPATSLDKSKHSIWRCRWHTDGMVAPFPTRYHQQIFYPAEGEGWYHGTEVSAALAHFGDEIELLEGFELSVTEPAPFGWVEGVYYERVKLLKEGDMAGQMLKLALNSCYGKLAQCRGRKGPKRKPPPWRNFWWAGFLTARARARVMELLTVANEPPIAIACDGVLLERPQQILTTSGRLGGWEVTEYEDLAMLAPGVYSYTVDGERYHKSRGFFGKDVDWQDLEDAILSGRNYSYETRRFIGLGVALQRKDAKLWRSWHEEPDRKIYAQIDRRERRDDGLLWPIREKIVSQPFIPSDGSIDVEFDEALDQPDIDT